MTVYDKNKSREKGLVNLRNTLLIDSCDLLLKKLQEIVDEFEIYKNYMSSNKHMYPLKEKNYGYLLCLIEKCKCAPESLKVFIESIIQEEQNSSKTTYDSKIKKIKEYISLIKNDYNSI